MEERLAPSWLKSLLAWCAILGAGLYGLSGRWDLQQRPGAVAFLLNADLALLCLPTFYYAFSLFHPRRPLHWGACALLWALFFLPYRRLGWAAHYRPHFNVAVLGPAEAHPQIWLPEALSLGMPAMPHEKLFMAAAGFVLVGLVFLLGAFAGLSRRPARTGFWALISLVLCASSWMHLGMRSPYTYLGLIQSPPAWYANQLCPEAGQGLVEGDYHFFEATEDIFRGQKISSEGTSFIRRPLMIFLSAQLSYFFNPFYVYLALNLAAWLLACFLLHQYVELNWGAAVARYATLLMACGPGFITYVAQPVVHFGGLAGVAISLGLFQAAFGEQEGRIPLARFFFFGAVLGILLLTYDHFPHLILFAALAWLRRLPWRPFLGSLLLGATLYALFNLLVFAMQLPLDLRNSSFLTGSLRQILTLLGSGDWLGLGKDLGLGTFIFFRSLLYAHFYVVPLLALFGCWIAPRGRALWEALWLIVPAGLTVVALQLGGVRWYFCGLAELPRFAFDAYPGIFILAAVALAWMAKRWGRWLPLMLVLGIFMLSNLDALGGPLPLLYYHYQWP